MYRAPRTTTVAVTASAATTGIVDMRDMATGSIQVPAGSSITTLELFATHYDPDGPDASTPVELYDEDNLGKTLTVAAGGVYRFPNMCYDVPFLAFKGDAAGNVSVFNKS